MSSYYYNQTKYSNVPYAYKGNGKTVSSSGCGVCCACMIVNNLIGKELFTVKQMAEFSLSNGARDNSGTNMNTLLKAICKKYTDFSFTTTNDESKVVSHLKAGGMAIANQGDVYNVFSDQGHFVVLDKMDGNNIDVLDPYMYSGKYDSTTRKKRIVKKTTNGCVVNTTELGKATADRSPAYYLVTYANPKTTTTTTKTTVKFDAGSTYTLTADVNVRTGAGTNYSIKKVKDLTADGKKNCKYTNSNSNAVLKSGTKVTALEVKYIGTDIWLRIPSGWICVYYQGKKYAKYY